MSYITEQDADTPLSRWQFEEVAGSTIDDDITATRDGTINGGVTLNQSGAFNNKAGVGADFDGTSGYVNFGDAAGLLGIGTIEAVVQFDTIPGSAANPIFTHAWSGGQIIPLAIGFNIDSANAGKLQVGYFTGAVWVTATWSTAPTAGVAYHIVGTYDGTTLKLRVNGSEVAVTTVGTVRPGAGVVNASAYIGRRWDTAQYHDGRIFDVAIYAAALSDVRANAHYAALANEFADNFADAGILSDGYQISGIDTTTWTTETGEPGTIDKTGWTTLTPTVSGPHTLSTVGSDHDTILNVYTGTIIDSLVLVASDDDSGGSGTSYLTTQLTSGTTYYVQVGSPLAGSGGILSFSVSHNANAQLSAISTEALVLASGAERTMTAMAVEALIDTGIAERMMSSISVEVLVPARLTHAGWGVPVRPQDWT